MDPPEPTVEPWSPPDITQLLKIDHISFDNHLLHYCQQHGLTPPNSLLHVHYQKKGRKGNPVGKEFRFTLHIRDIAAGVHAVGEAFPPKPHWWYLLNFQKVVGAIGEQLRRVGTAAAAANAAAGPSNASASRANEGLAEGRAGSPAAAARGSGSAEGAADIPTGTAAVAGTAAGTASSSAPPTADADGYDRVMRDTGLRSYSDQLFPMYDPIVHWFYGPDQYEQWMCERRSRAAPRPRPPPRPPRHQQQQQQQQLGGSEMGLLGHGGTSAHRLTRRQFRSGGCSIWSPVAPPLPLPVAVAVADASLPLNKTAAAAGGGGRRVKGCDSRDGDGGPGSGESLNFDIAGACSVCGKGMGENEWEGAGDAEGEDEGPVVDWQVCRGVNGVGPHWLHLQCALMLLARRKKLPTAEAAAAAAAAEPGVPGGGGGGAAGAAAAVAPPQSPAATIRAGAAEAMDIEVTPPPASAVAAAIAPPGAPARAAANAVAAAAAPAAAGAGATPSPVVAGAAATMPPGAPARAAGAPDAAAVASSDVQCDQCVRLEDMMSAGVGDAGLTNQYLHSRAAADIAAWRQDHVRALEEGGIDSRCSGTSLAVQSGQRDLHDLAESPLSHMR